MTVEYENGREFETSFFGFRRPFVYKPFKPIEEALIEVVSAQKRMCWSPKCPTTDIAKELFFDVKAELELPSGNYHFCRQSKNLSLYCALNSVLDFHFGIDGFFSVSDKDPLKFTPADIVTFDLTLIVYPSKKAGQKADFLITASDLHDPMNTEYLVGKIVAKLRATQ